MRQRISNNWSGPPWPSNSTHSVAHALDAAAEGRLGEVVVDRAVLLEALEPELLDDLGELLLADVVGRHHAADVADDDRGEPHVVGDEALPLGVDAPADDRAGGREQQPLVVDHPRPRGIPGDACAADVHDVHARVAPAEVLVLVEDRGEDRDVALVRRARLDRVVADPRVAGADLHALLLDLRDRRLRPDHRHAGVQERVGGVAEVVALGVEQARAEVLDLEHHR
jgi:hypothetical protein